MQKDYSSLKIIFLTVGIILAVIGIVFIIIGFTSFPGEDESPDVMEDSFEEFGQNMDSSSEKNQKAITMLGVGAFMLIPGLGLIYISQFRKVASYVATEASPAIKTGSKAFGKGLKESGISNTKEKEIIKIRCPHCGYLESEDAKFCSNCSKKI
jgi:hypothetical protein